MVNAGWIVCGHAYSAQILIRPYGGRLARCWLILTGYVRCDEFYITDGFTVAMPVKSHAESRLGRQLLLSLLPAKSLLSLTAAANAAANAPTVILSFVSTFTYKAALLFALHSSLHLTNFHNNPVYKSLYKIHSPKVP